MFRFTLYYDQISAVVYSLILHLFLFPSIYLSVPDSPLTLIYYVVALFAFGITVNLFLKTTHRYTLLFIIVLLCIELLQNHNPSYIELLALMGTCLLIISAQYFALFVSEVVKTKIVIKQSTTNHSNEYVLIAWVLGMSVFVGTLGVVTPLGGIVIVLCLSYIALITIRPTSNKVLYMISIWPLLMYLLPFAATHIFATPAPIINGTIIEPFVYVISKSIGHYFASFPPSFIINILKSITISVSSAWIYFFMSFVSYQVYVANSLPNRS